MPMPTGIVIVNLLSVMRSNGSGTTADQGGTIHSVGLGSSDDDRQQGPTISACLAEK